MSSFFSPNNIIKLMFAVKFSVVNIFNVALFSKLYFVFNVIWLLVIFTFARMLCSVTYLNLFFIQTIPFWPNNTPAKNLKIKIDDSPIESVLFDFQSNVNLLLRLDNKVCVKARLHRRFLLRY